MENFFSTYRTPLLIALGIFLALLAAWWGLSGDGSSDPLLTAEDTSGSILSDRGIVDTLLQLRAVSLSGTIFSDPAFASLQDFGTQIVPEPIGRPNPFAPFTARSTSTPAGSTQLFGPRRR